MNSEFNLKNKANSEILIVEDSPTQAIKLQYILEKNDYKSTVAQNGKDALDAIKNNIPSIIISDIVMPEMNGFQLCKHIKSDEGMKHIPVILLTTLCDPLDIIRGLECGANNFITKPYNEEFLICRIQYILMNSELRKGRSAEMGLEIFFRGKKHFIDSDSMQILDLLFSSFESALQKNQELQQANRKLKETLDTVQTLEGLIPICANCKKIRDDKGFWSQVEEYIVKHSAADFTHSICPDCSQSLYPEIYKKE